MTRPLSLNCSLGNNSVTRCTTILFVMHDKKGCCNIDSVGLQFRPQIRQSPVFQYYLCGISVLFLSVLFVFYYFISVIICILLFQDHI